MKKIFFTLFTILPFIVCAQNKKAAPSIYTKEVGSSLPALRIVDTSNQVFTNDSFQSKEFLLLFLFNPSCGHCIDAGTLLKQNCDSFKNVHVAFMAGAMMLPYMSTFYNATKIEQCNQYTIGVDSAGVIEQLYNYIALPQLNIYNKERKLVKILNGNISMATLRPYLNLP